MSIDFTVVLRGYDRPAVDAALADALAATELDEPQARADAATRLRGSAFRVALRGYDRLQVDHFVQVLAAELAD